MKISEEYALDSEGRTRLYNNYVCDYCGVKYKKQSRQASKSKYEHYCSIGCGNNHNINTNIVECICSHCGILFSRKKSRLKNSKHSVYFCSRECKDFGQSYIKQIQPPHYNTGESNYRSKALAAFANKCSICSYADVNALEVHHIDKDRTNNSLNNLIILCANCHTLVHKNKIHI